MKECSMCGERKSLNQFAKNGKYIYTICKSCKRLRMDSWRYRISVVEAAGLRNQSHCECCGVAFTRQREQHIHHVGTGVRGVVCQKCNHILHQETVKDYSRIRCCLSFMDQPRKNLFGRVNPQGRSTAIPSTTKRPARCGYRVCTICGEDLPLSSFSMNRQWHRKQCKECCVHFTLAREYGLTHNEVRWLKQRSVCECCGCQFTDKNVATIHHVGDRVLGLVCDSCNRCLGQETPERREQLLACANYIAKR